MSLTLLGGSALALWVMNASRDGTPKLRRVRDNGQLQGVHQDLRALMAAWEFKGTHDVFIPRGAAQYAAGGLRAGPEAESAQNKAYLAGHTKARTLKDTPHGRGAALDVWPEGYRFNLAVEAQPEMMDKLVAFGLFAEENGFEWGGRWTSFKDWPHVEIRNWRQL